MEYNGFPVDRPQQDPSAAGKGGPMMRSLLTAVAMLVIFAVPAVAQYPNQPLGSYRPMGGYGGYGGSGAYGRPGLSPYLNMLRGGSPAANYYLGVVLEFERRALDVQYGSALIDLERRAAAPASGEDEDLLPSLPGTGHPAVFGYYQPYFNMGRPAYAQPTTGAI